MAIQFEFDSRSEAAVADPYSYVMAAVNTALTYGMTDGAGGMSTGEFKVLVALNNTIHQHDPASAVGGGMQGLSN